MIWNAFAFTLIRMLFRAGLAPKGAIIRKSLSALADDRLDEAVDAYFEVAKKDFAHERVQVLREILISEIRFRKKALVERREKLLSDSTEPSYQRDHELASCDKAEEILDRFLSRLGVGMRELCEKKAEEENPPPS